MVGPGRPAHLDPLREALASPLDATPSATRSAAFRERLILGEAEVAERLPTAECIEAMAEVLGAHARGEAEMPLRSVHAGDRVGRDARA